MQDEIFRSQLLPQERIMWSGRPGQGVIFQPLDGLLIPFTLLWCGFAIYWTISALTTNAPPFFILFGSIFVCVGLFMVVGRFWFDAWVRKATIYALTDRRVLVSQSRPFRKFTAVGLAQLPDIHLTERRDGRGTIRFGAARSFTGNSGLSIWVPSLDPVPQFIAIVDAPRVFQMIQNMAEQHRTH